MGLTPEQVFDDPRIIGYRLVLDGQPQPWYWPRPDDCCGNVSLAISSGRFAASRIVIQGMTYGAHPSDDMEPLWEIPGSEIIRLWQELFGDIDDD